MDHQAFVSSLPEDQKRALTARSDSAGILHLIGHVGAIVIVSALIVIGVPLWPLLLPVQGILLVFLFTLEHEATHKTPFRSEGLNEWVGRLCGLLLFLPFEWFRYFHLAHHRYTNIPGKDPELAEAKPETRLDWARHVSGIGYWRGMIRHIVVNASGRADAPYLPQKALPRIRREARVMLLVYAALAMTLTWTNAAIWLWLLPLLFGQPFLRLYLLAEHGRCPQVTDMFQNSRTTFTTAIVRFLAWNMPYHAEHHAYPSVPYHKLPDLHRLTAPYLGVTEQGYARFTRGYVRELGQPSQEV